MAKRDVGFCVYIGPTVKGLIQSGTVFPTTRENAIRAHRAVFSERAGLLPLLVASDALPDALKAVKTPGSALYGIYKKAAKNGGREV